MYDAHQWSPPSRSTNPYNGPAPVLSSTPILQAPHGARFQPRATSRGVVSGTPWTFSQLLQQIPRPGITLPIVACLLILLNHIGAIFRFIYSVGLIDCVALLCLLGTVVIATQQLQNYVHKTAGNAVVQLLQLADSKVMLAKVAEIANADPAPGRWLDMYYTMCGDISGLHQENVKMRTIMSGMLADIEHLKSKGKYFHPVRTMYRKVSGPSKDQAEMTS